ncbi:hypothetical protein [Aquimarina spinulae]|uniref:hypothetical protein n=1 Tax=Aquimarina spinulae TaxID=1192023 RepID=UPI000D54DB05|nr:hypothetical protein [Aquimarina spinulae]
MKKILDISKAIILKKKEQKIINGGKADLCSPNKCLVSLHLMIKCCSGKKCTRLIPVIGVPNMASGVCV